MAGFIGIKCIACDKAFNEKDDIVVCPDCGTPYHRSCYQEAGNCINTELHAKGGTFRVVPEAKIIDDEAIADKATCSRCGAENPPLSLFCERCGMPLAMPESHSEKNNSQSTPPPMSPFNSLNGYAVNYSDPMCGFNPEEDFEGVKLSELAAFVGDNTYYYLPMFKRMKETGRKLTWNFIAMLMPSAYYAYRKMNWWILLAFVVQFAIGLPTTLLMLSTSGLLPNLPFDIKGASFQVIYSFCSLLSYGLLFAAGGFSNWLYYRHALASIKKLKAKEIATPERIKAAGGGSKLYVILFFAALVIIGILGGIALGTTV